VALLEASGSLPHGTCVRHVKQTLEPPGCEADGAVVARKRWLPRVMATRAPVVETIRAPLVETNGAALIEIGRAALIE
jgi:hypothetical protein